MIERKIESLRTGYASKTMAAEYVKRHLYRGYRPCREVMYREYVADSDYYLCTFEDGSQLIDDELFLVLIASE